MDTFQQSCVARSILLYRLSLFVLFQHPTGLYNGVPLDAE